MAAGESLVRFVSAACAWHRILVAEGGLRRGRSTVRGRLGSVSARLRGSLAVERGLRDVRAGRQRHRGRVTVATVPGILAAEGWLLGGGRVMARWLGLRGAVRGRLGELRVA